MAGTPGDVDDHPRSGSGAGTVVVVVTARFSQGNGLKGSARMAGIDKEVGYRFLRDRYLELRRSGVTAADTLQAIGFSSSRVPAWEAAVE